MAGQQTNNQPLLELESAASAASWGKLCLVYCLVYYTPPFHQPLNLSFIFLSSTFFTWYTAPEVAEERRTTPGRSARREELVRANGSIIFGETQELSFFGYAPRAC